MTKRRDKGDGSIYQRASDKKWVGYARLDQGKKKYVYGNTKAEASKKLKELQRSGEQGTLVTAKAETVEAYLQHWLRSFKQQAGYQVRIEQKIDALKAEIKADMAAIEGHIIDAVGNAYSRLFAEIDQRLPKQKGE